MLNLKFECTTHPDKKAKMVCAVEECPCRFMCDVCWLHHKFQKISHENKTYSIKQLIHPEIVQKAEEHIPNEILTMLSEITIQKKRINEQFEKLANRLLLELEKFIVQTFSVSTIDNIKSNIIGIQEKIPVTNSLNDFRDFAINFSHLENEIKNVNLDSYRIKFGKMTSFFDKIEKDFSEFLDKKVLEMEKEKEKVNSQISLNNMLILQNSTVLKDNPSREFVALKLLSTKQGIELIYRASRDGATPQDFHTYCDLKGPTLIIVRSGVYIFGGYTEASWTFEQVGVQKPCASSFLFSYNLRQKYTIKSDQVQNAIYCRYNCGPVFGKGGYDLFMCAGNLTSNGSTPCTFGQEGENFSHFSLGGARDFDVDDYEVYKVKN